MAPWWLRAYDELVDPQLDKKATPKTTSNSDPSRDSRTTEPDPKNPAKEPEGEASRGEPQKRRRRRRSRKAAQVRQSPATDDAATESRRAVNRGGGELETDRTKAGEAHQHPLNDGSRAEKPRAAQAAPADDAQDAGRKIALFLDLETIALGFRGSQIRPFDISVILGYFRMQGQILVKKAYADWQRHGDHKRSLHEAAFELIDIPEKQALGMYRADIKMAVDAMDICYSKDHLDTFVLVTGDSGLSPLISKLKENNRYVIAVGVENASADLLTADCDELFSYEELSRQSRDT